MKVREQLTQIMHDDRTGAATAAGTVAASLATVFDWIPQNIGNAGVAVGIILSITLVVVNIRAEVRKTKLDNLEIQKRKKELERLND